MSAGEVDRLGQGAPRLRILSWNINGLRPAITKHKSLLQLLESLEADIICFQEVKLRQEDFLRERDLAIAEGWCAWATVHAHTMSGVASA